MTDPAVSLVEPLLPPSEGEVHAEEVEPSAPEAEVQEVLLDEPVESGETQPPKCQDVTFAILFLVQIGVVLYYCITSIKSIESCDFTLDDDDYDDPDGIHIVHLALSVAFPFLYISLAAAGTSLFLSIGGMSIATGSFCKLMIKCALISSPLSFTVMAVYTGVILGDIRGAAMFGFLAMIGICYATSAWHRIPFAAANLATAICAIRVHISSILAVSVVITTLILGWLIACVIVFLGYLDESSPDTTDGLWKRFESMASGDGVRGGDDDDGDFSPSSSTVLVFLGVALSYLWTCGVLHNIVHCTVTGVVGTWWFAPSDASHCCSPAVGDSLFRSMTYSFGSICFGSLVLAIVQVAHLFIKIVRSQEADERRRARRGSPSIYLCLLDCLLRLLERLVQYVNRWAFVYVGLYGYDFLTAGSKVWTLFRSRGWSVILNDHLVHRCLSMMSMMVGMICAGVANLMVVLNPSWASPSLLFLSRFSNGDDPIDTSALLLFASTVGFIYGVTISTSIFKPIRTAVDTVVVCFAEAPHAFSAHHPELSRRMREAWIDTYPSEYSVDDP